jgi:hypothetical protein
LGVAADLVSTGFWTTGGSTFTQIVDRIQGTTIKDGWASLGPAYKYDTSEMWGYRKNNFLTSL